MITASILIAILAFTYLLAGLMCVAMIYEMDLIGGIRQPISPSNSVLMMIIWPLIAVIFIVMAIRVHRNHDVRAEDEDW